MKINTKNINMDLNMQNKLNVDKFTQRTASLVALAVYLTKLQDGESISIAW